MIYKNFVRPVLFKLDAEKAHCLALKALDAACVFPGRGALRSFFGFDDPLLSTKVFDLSFPNPVGLAAGFDKDAKHMEALSVLGFGFLEVGTVTFHSQPGNPKPRIRRIPEAEAIWNHMGFNNQGAEAMESRLKNAKVKIPLGINIGKSRIVPIEKAFEDYLSSFQILFPYGDYFVLNVSSPNTAGLRLLQEKENLSQLLSQIQNENTRLAEEHHTTRKPLLVKISPDLSFDALDAVLEAASEYAVQGIVATNTTLSREGLSVMLPEEGGISGAPIRRRSTEIIRHIYRQAGKKIKIIGSGGVFSAKDAYEKIQAGAAVVQVYSGLIYEGPGLLKKIKSGLLESLRNDGMTSIEQACGTKAF